MHVVRCVCAWNFGTKFFLRRGKCEIPRKSNFLKNGKIVILVKIVSRNLATTSNFVEFRDSRNLHVFLGNERRAGHLAHF